jgi:hypothetical protein
MTFGTQSGEGVSLTHWPPLPPGMFLVLIYTRRWVEARAMEGSEGDMSLKNPVTPPGIDPGTVRLVAQRLNHYATPGPHLFKSSYTFPMSGRPRTNTEHFRSSNFLIAGANFPTYNLIKVWEGSLALHFTALNAVKYVTNFVLRFVI